MTCVRRPSLLVVFAAGWMASVPHAVGAGDGAPGPGAAAREVSRVELDALAIRIEALKRDIAAGRARPEQLRPLLSRAQELADALERENRAPLLPSPSAAPDPQELHERADALRDRADRLGAAVQQLERRIAEERRRARLEDRLQALGGDVLADGTPRRAQASPRGAAANAPPPAPPSAQPGTASAPGTTTGGAAAPPAATGAPAPDPSARAITAPAARDPEGLLPRDGDSVPELLRKRTLAQRELDALRAGADALDAEARAAEKMR